MMKLIIRQWTIALLIVSFLPASADRYEKMWKKTYTYIERDLPKTAIQSVDDIIEYAQKKGDNGQLLKGIITRYQLCNEIAYDSAACYMDQLQSNTDWRTDPGTQALYHLVMGLLYPSRTDIRREEALKKSKKELLLALDNPQALAQIQATQYVPLIIIGKDSRHFQDDLLHVIARHCLNSLRSYPGNEQEEMRTTMLNKVLPVYRQQGNREAELFLTLEGANSLKEDQQATLYEEVIRQFGDLSICSEAYRRLGNNAWLTDSIRYTRLEEALKRYPQSPIANELKNLMAQLSQTTLSIELPASHFAPNTLQQASISGRNCTKGELVFYKTACDAQSKEVWRNDEKTWNGMMKTPCLRVPFALAKAFPTSRQKATVSYRLEEPGIYLVRLETDNIHSTPQLVYVSRLHIRSIPIAGNQQRLVISDLSTGAPVAGAQAVVRNMDEQRTLWKTLTANSQGEIVMSYSYNERKPVYALTSSDQYCPPLFLFKSYNRRGEGLNIQKSAAIYTDRSAYRPGQKVQVGGFLYTQIEDNTSVLPMTETILKLQDANGKEINRQAVTTDSLGAFKASFTLPEKGLNGWYTLQADRLGSTSFVVEEYKRPTFSVFLDEVNTSYQEGDTIYIHGKAQTYAGFPIAHRPVAYTIHRRQAFWYDYRGHTATLLTQDTLFTDEKGRFNLPVILSKDNSLPQTHALFLQYDVNASVTTQDGETRWASQSVYLGNRPATLSTTLPATICKEDEKSFILEERNVSGQLIKGKASFRILQDKHCIQKGTCDLNKLLSTHIFRSLPSGQYIWEVIPEDRKDTLVILRHSFTIFSINDQRIAHAPFMVYIPTEEFRPNKAVPVFIGSSQKDLYVHMDCYANNNCIDSRIIQLDSSAFKTEFSYKEEYGQGVALHFSYLKDGKLHNETRYIRQPQPDKQLKIKWNVFRNRLQPGEKETWSLNISRNGKPATASLLATLYDASLDPIAYRPWSFQLFFNRNIFTPYWNILHNYPQTLSTSARLKRLNFQDWNFSHIDEQLLPANPPKVSRLYRGKTLASAMVAMDMKTMVEGNIVNDAVAKESATAPTPKSENKNPTALRTDFNETAFFASGLTTDRQGNIQISFQLPQSLTRWNFRAIAHDQDMNYARIDTSAIASKPFMLQTHMPRFLRAGDQTEITATLRNALNERQRGTVLLELIDPQTNTTILALTQPFDAKAEKETIVSFPVTVTDRYPLLICRIIADNRHFSDGEQHYMPILEDRQEVTETFPITLTEGKNHILTLPADNNIGNKEASHRTLTIEYTSHPLWTAIDALPSLAQPLNKDAMTLARSYYALALATYEVQKHPSLQQLAETWRRQGKADSLFLLLERHPELKQILLDETPWATTANECSNHMNQLWQLFDTLSVNYRLHSCADRLLDLQNTQGAWTWFKGMTGNLHATLEVAENLARIQKTAPQAMLPKLSKALQRSILYLHKEAAKAIEIHKKHKTSPIGESLLRYLYICALTDIPRTANISYLIQQLQAHAGNYDLYTKALAARILTLYGKKNQAQNLTTSLLEHTVYSPEGGRGFDPSSRTWTRDFYRIGAHIALMEVLAESTDTTTLKEMAQWLMQSKRTQYWKQSGIATDAIYFLFNHYSTPLETPNTSFPSIIMNMKDGTSRVIVTEENMQQMATMGYIYETIQPKEQDQLPVSISLQPADQHMAFAAVHLKYTLPTRLVKARDAGIRLSAQYEVKRGSQWKTISQQTVLHKGDLVRVCYTIKADRDYDFVSLKTGRAACMEPVNTASGYTGQCYREVEDASCNYFFQHISKGTTWLEDSFTIDRTGTFSTAAPSLQCTYAPEFSARTAATSFKVKQ